MTKEPTKVAGYVRVSSKIQVDEGESLSTQKQQIKDFAKSKEWDLVGIYSDEGLSGSKIEHRVQLLQMIEDAKKGQFSIIVFTKLSRFARNVREYHNISYDLQKHNVYLASIKENIDPTTQVGKMIAGILALFAEWEHETIREQMAENRIIRWRENRAFIGKPPFGYTWNKEINKLEINVRESDIYHRIVKMYVNQRLSLRDIAIKLNSEGLKCKRAAWSNVTVSYILKNPAYYGTYIVNKYLYEDGNKGVGTRRSKREKPSSEWIEFPIPNLISKTRWDKIQQVIQFNKVKSKRCESTTEFFLRDSIICGRCGAKVKPRIGSKRKDGSALRYYVCYWAGTSSKNLISSGRHKCSLPFIKAESVETNVWVQTRVLLSLNKKKAFGKIFDPVIYEEQITDLKEQTKRFKIDESLLQRRRDNIFKLGDNKDISIEEQGKRLRENRTEQIEIELNLKELKNKLEDLIDLRNKKKEISDFITSNKEQFKKLHKDIYNLTLEDRKILIEAMLDRPIILDYQDDDEIDGPGGVSTFYTLKINTAILQRFMEEGKIFLDKNSPFNPSSTNFTRSLGNHKDSFNNWEVRE